jgi:hypothetical protein
MKHRIARVVVAFLSLVVSATPLTFAQSSTQTVSALPRLVRFGGTVKDLNGSPMTGVVGITFSLYTEQTGGAALWLETQNVTADNNGHYTALLGSTKPDGLPAELFTSEQARWVGVQVSGQAEQPRVLLVSAPYALKAGDAETIGGLPPSAFVLAAPAATTSVAAGGTAETVSPAVATGVTTTGGTLNYLPIFSGATTIIDSAVFQTGSGATAKVGIDTTTPATRLDVNGNTTIRGTLSFPAVGTATATAGDVSQGLNFVASSYNSTSSTAVNQTFRWQAEPAANDTTAPSGTLNLLYGLGTAAPTETGLKLSSKGLFTFATGQTFPGVVLADAANTFTGNQTVDGTITATTGSGNAVSGSSTIGSGVVGTAGSSAGAGVYGSGLTGVEGVSSATNGTTFGVLGTDASPTGVGVEGKSTATGGGVGVFGSTVAAAGFGVEGINTSGNGTGVYGTAAHFGVQGVATGSGSTVGVYGAGADGLQGSGTLHGVYAAGTGAASMGVYGTSPVYGLYGVATNTTGTSFGVYGSGGSNGVYGTASNFGLYGVATATSGNSVGVYGKGVDGLQGSGSTYGVYAAGTGASATGVYATTGSAAGYGVEGVNASGNGTGVYGTAAHFGVQGIATGSSNTVGVFGAGVDGLQGSGTLHGVYAAGNGAGSYGVYSITTAGTAGIYGVFQSGSVLGSEGPWELDSDPGANFSLAVNTQPQAGVWADTNWNGDATAGQDYAPALLATADANVAGILINNSNNVPTILAENYGAAGGDGFGGAPTPDVVRAVGRGGSCSLTGGGDAACTGVLKSVVATKGSAGADRVETYSVQSAENWFEDAGTAQIVNGAGRVNLESVFGQTVNTGVEYHVFLTPDGDCKGLYVSAKTASGFEVHELGGGASNIAFEYRIMAKRVGYENMRLANVTERFNRQKAQSQKMQRPARSSAASRSGSQITTSPVHPTVEQQLAPKTLVLPVLPWAAPRPAPVTPKLTPTAPVRAGLQPMAAQPK